MFLNINPCTETYHMSFVYHESFKNTVCMQTFRPNIIIKLLLSYVPVCINTLRFIKKIFFLFTDSIILISECFAIQNKSSLEMHDDENIISTNKWDLPQN